MDPPVSSVCRSGQLNLVHWVVTGVLLMSVVLVTGEGTPGGSYFYGSHQGFSILRVSDECHRDNMTRYALLFSSSSTHGFVLHQSWCDKRPLAKGAAMVSCGSLLHSHCCLCSGSGGFLGTG